MKSAYGEFSPLAKLTRKLNSTARMAQCFAREHTSGFHRPFVPQPDPPTPLPIRSVAGIWCAVFGRSDTKEEEDRTVRKGDRERRDGEGMLVRFWGGLVCFLDYSLLGSRHTHEAHKTRICYVIRSIHILYMECIALMLMSMLTIFKFIL